MEPLSQLNWYLSRLEQPVFDLVIFLGDFSNLSHAPHAVISPANLAMIEANLTSACHVLSEFCPSLVVVPGNHDPMSLYAANLRQSTSVSQQGEALYWILHGSALRVAPDLVLYGLGGSEQWPFAPGVHINRELSGVTMEELEGLGLECFLSPASFVPVPVLRARFDFVRSETHAAQLGLTLGPFFGALSMREHMAPTNLFRARKLSREVQVVAYNHLAREAARMVLPDSEFDVIEGTEWDMTRDDLLRVATGLLEPRLRESLCGPLPLDQFLSPDFSFPECIDGCPNIFDLCWDEEDQPGRPRRAPTAQPFFSEVYARSHLFTEASGPLAARFREYASRQLDSLGLEDRGLSRDALAYVEGHRDPACLLKNVTDAPQRNYWDLQARPLPAPAQSLPQPPLYISQRLSIGERISEVDRLAKGGPVLRPGDQVLLCTHAGVPETSTTWKQGAQTVCMAGLTPFVRRAAASRRIVGWVHGHEHAPDANMADFEGVPVCNPGSIARGYFAILELERVRGLWRVRSFEHRRLPGIAEPPVMERLRAYLDAGKNQ